MYLCNASKHIFNYRENEKKKKTVVIIYGSIPVLFGNFVIHNTELQTLLLFFMVA